jgi:hypothetical protein
MRLIHKPNAQSTADNSTFLKYINLGLLFLYFLLESTLLSAKTLEIVGEPEEPFAEYLREYDAIEEHLIIRDGRIFIKSRFRDSSADIGSTVYTRHYIRSRERWTNIIKGMKGKDPEIMDEIDVEEVVNFLYELKKP